MTGGWADTNGETKPRTEALGMEDDASSEHFDCDPKTLALIAAQFMVAGDDETEALRKAGMLQEEALRKANALYNAACEYAKRFASLSADDQAIELDPENVRELETPDLAIGDSEANSPALAHFREIATTKTGKNITHREFVKRIEQHFGPFTDEDSKRKFPKTIAPFALVGLHSCIRAARSRAKSERRKKSVKENRRAG
jgi:hypothetical protein